MRNIETIKSIPILEAQADRLNHISGQRQSVYLRIGEGGVKVTVDNLSRIGRIKEKIENSWLRAETALERVNGRIRDLELIARAQSHEALFLVQTAELDTIHGYARHLSNAKELITTKEEEVARLKAAPSEDPDLKRGFDLLMAERKSEEERVKTPHVLFDESQKSITVRILGIARTAKVPQILEVEYQVAKLLAANPGKEIPTWEIGKMAALAQRSTSDIVGWLRKSFEPDPKNPQVFVKRGYGEQTKYSLKGEVEFAGNEGQGRKATERPKATLGTRADALNLFITGQEFGLTELAAALGDTKSGHKLNWKMMERSLINAINNLHIRLGKELANSEEVKLWRALKTFSGKSRDDLAVQEVRGRIIRWFRANRPERSEQQLIDIGPERLEAVRIFLTHESATLKQLIDALPDNKAGKPFSAMQARVSIVNTVRRLQARATRQTLAPEELELWKQVKTSVGIENDQDVVGGFRNLFIPWVEKQRKS